MIKIDYSLKQRFIQYLFSFTLLTTLSVLAALYPVWISSFTHILFPIFVLLIFGMLTRFGYIKLSTLVIGRALIVLATLGYGAASIHIVCLILLQLNILEAVLLDVVKKNYLNALSGMLLLASSFFLLLEWTGSYVLVVNESYLLWIIAYTVWNANFVTLHLTGAYYIHHFLLLLSPIVASLVLGDFSYWLLFRETSLLLGIASLATIKQKLHQMEHASPYTNWFESIQEFIQHKKTQCTLLSITAGCILIQFYLF